VWEDLFVMRHFPRLSGDFRVPPRRIAARFGAEHVDAVDADLTLEGLAILAERSDT